MRFALFRSLLGKEGHLFHQMLIRCHASSKTIDQKKYKAWLVDDRTQWITLYENFQGQLTISRFFTLGCVRPHEAIFGNFLFDI